MFDEINFTGTERLHLEIAGLDRDSEPMMQKILLWTQSNKSQEQVIQAVYTFSLIEEHGILATTRKLRNSYRGSLDEIIKNIAVGHLNKNVDISYTWRYNYYTK